MFASGDVRTGAATVVEAIGEGRRASYAIDYWLRGHDLDDPQVRRIVSEPQPSFLTIVPFTDDVEEPRAIMGKLEADERRDNFGEYEHGYTHDQAMGEAARNLEPFEDAYARTDWSRFESLPLFGVANRINAYNTYLLMEREGMGR